jgi:uncharacterized membrane protein YkoI
MDRKRKLTLGAAVVAAALAAGTGVVVARGDDSEAAISGSALEKASAAALDHTGGGRVTGTEIGDEDSYYEVEVTLDNGSQVDVQLDASFKVVDSNADEESAGDKD